MALKILKLQSKKTLLVGREGCICVSFIYYFFNVCPVGPRIFLGETLAKTEMFIIFGNMVQKFKLCKVSPDEVLSFEGLMGQIMYSEPYKLRAEARN